MPTILERIAEIEAEVSSGIYTSLIKLCYCHGILTS